MKKIEFYVSNEIMDLLSNRCQDGNQQNFARTLFLKNLSAEYGAMEDDETMKRIEHITEKLNE